jgi:hypothetical protein
MTMSFKLLEAVPSFILDRGLWFSAELDDPACYEDTDREPAGSYGEANLIGSRITRRRFPGIPVGDTHLPVIDLDFSAYLEASTSPGHYHLYLNRDVSWWRYKKVLKAMYKAGLIEKGFYRLSVKRGQTFVRRPGVRKKFVRFP